MKHIFFSWFFISMCLMNVSVNAAQKCCKDSMKNDPDCNTICQETSCGEGYKVFDRDPKVCACVCTEESQTNANCQGNYVFDQDKCDCVCGGEQSCDEGLTWDSDKCECICSEQSCETNKKWDQESCKCVCDTEVSCGANKTQNKETCACECTNKNPQCAGGQEWDEENCACKCPEGQELVTVAAGSAAWGGGGEFGGICCPTGQTVVFRTGGDPSTARCCDGNATSSGSAGGQHGAGCACPKQRLKTSMLQDWWYSYIDIDSDMCCPDGSTVVETDGGSKICCKGSRKFEGGSAGRNSNGTLDATCCKKAGGSIRGNKCCKCSGSSC